MCPASSASRTARTSRGQPGSAVSAATASGSSTCGELLGVAGAGGVLGHLVPLGADPRQRRPVALADPPLDLRGVARLHVAQHPGQPPGGGAVQPLRLVGVRVALGDQVGVVRLPPARQRHVGGLPRGRLVEQRVAGRHGAALRRVHRRGVGQGQVLVDVAARQVRDPAVGAAHPQRPVRVEPQHRVDRPVRHVLPAVDPDGPVHLAGLHPVPDARPRRRPARRPSSVDGSGATAP